VKSVVLSVPSSAQGKVLLNLIRHLLELRDLNVATTIDLQRLQIVSQLIVVVRRDLTSSLPPRLTRRIELWRPYMCLFEQHGLAMLLFPPLLSKLFDQANKAHGRNSAASVRNCAARIHHVTTALCCWFKCVALPCLT